MSVVVIDGSMGEGGGQILRYSLSLSALTLKPVRIFNIRAKRSNPGLRPQHLTAVKALQTITNARVEGASVGSMEIYFEPRTRKPGNYIFNIGTAGSVSLVIQAILPTLLFSNGYSRVEITGGTDVPWSPPIDYMRFVFSYNLRLFGVNINIKLLRRGHYPRGGGRVVLEINPVKDRLKPISMVERGDIKGIKGISHAVKLPSHVAERQARSASQYIREKLGIEPVIEIETYPSDKDPHLGPGSGIVLYADVECNSRLGGDSLGARGKRAEIVGREAAEKLVYELTSNMCFDSHMGDMLIPYMFLAAGKSIVGVSNITLHTLTAIEVSKKFLPEAHVEIEGSRGDKGRIIIEGVGFSP
ncbi:MAG: RNA 3'-phosphate cyclase [Desulfurococcales archaeon ex4484_58]|nr:MAG: RNA 3'-phosphate cyclase [Desulfurococcales archaeon ex4484_58]